MAASQSRPSRPTLLNVVLIAVLLVFIAAGGSDQNAAGTALAWGIAASGLLQVLVVAIAAAKTGMRLPWQRPQLSPEMRRLVELAVPGVIAGGIAQLTVVVSTIIATLQDRVVSWLYYADRLFQLPLGVIGVAIGVVLLPTLSHKLRSGDHAAVLESENRALEFALLLTLPAALALFLAAEPIMRVLFERGAFTAVDTKATASMLAALALGLPAYVLVKVLHPSFFAREDTKTPMLYAGISLAANVILSLMLFLLIGATGIALATALAGWINVALLVAELARRESFALDDTFRRRICPHPRRMRGDGGGRVRSGQGLGCRLRPAKRARRAGGLAPCRGRRGARDLSRRGACCFGAANFRDLIKDAGG